MSNRSQLPPMSADCARLNAGMSLTEIDHAPRRYGEPTDSYKRATSLPTRMAAEMECAGATILTCHKPRQPAPVAVLCRSAYKAGQAAGTGAKRPARAKGMNSTERRFLALHTELRAEDWESVTFKLAPGLRYTPDFTHFLPGAAPICCEVKGAHIWDGARDKFLMARRVFPGICWQAWQWRHGTWTEIWKA